MAGRTAVLELLPLSMPETPSKTKDLDFLITQGFYPICHKENIEPSLFYKEYLKSYLETDVRQLISPKETPIFKKFMKICASKIGQIINHQNIANELGISTSTIDEWTYILEASFIITRLPPYFENLGKNTATSPKLYFVDVGLAAYLNSIYPQKKLQRESLIENLAIMEIIKSRYNQGQSAYFYFFRDSNQNEIDLVLQSGSEIIPIEIKSSNTFDESLIKGLKYFKSLAPDRVKTGYLLYPGNIEQKVQGFQLLSIKNINKIFNSI